MRKIKNILVTLLLWYCIGTLYHWIRYFKEFNPNDWDLNFSNFYAMIGAFAILLAIADDNKTKNTSSRNH